MIADHQDSIAFLMDSFQAVTGISASTTQSQGNGVIGYGVSIVGTVANDNDAITLPLAVKHHYVTVVNQDSAQHLELWPSSGDAIDGGSVDASVIVGPNQYISLIAKDNTDWVVIARNRIVEDSITAFAGGGQANATLIRSEVARVSIVATNGDSVKLPPAKPGLMVALYNDDSAQYCEVFANDDTPDVIGDFAASDGMILTPNMGVIFFCVTTARWNVFARDLPYVSSFTANVAQAQGTGVVCDGFTRISVVANDGDSVTLPAAYLGNECTLFNDDQTSAQYVQVFPSSGNEINDLGVNQPLYLFPGQTVNFKATSTGWKAPPASTPGQLTGIVANGTVIGTATQLIADWNIIATSTATDNAVQLPPFSRGRKVWILNDDSTDAVLVFPKSGASAQINDLAIDTSITLAAKSSVELRAVTATKWKT